MSNKSSGEKSPGAPKRVDLLKRIEKKRNSKIVTYFLGDRRGAQARIAEDAVRFIYEHLRSISSTKKIDLFIYSVGGSTEVPWRIVTMIREFADELAVLIPYKAMSAATLISLGADEIVMCPKGELGPIDPQMEFKYEGEDGTSIQKQLSVEDIMSYVRFLRDKAGLTDQSALSQPIAVLAEKLDPWMIGSVNRVHAHIRSVARKLLTGRAKDYILDEQRLEVIVETLTEKIYQHGHAIGRTEAEEIGLNVVRPEEDIENLIWNLFECYEDLCKLQHPIDPRTFIPKDADENSENVIMGCIESTALAHHFTSELKLVNKRQPQPQLNLNLNLNLQLPPNLKPEQLPKAAQEALQGMMEKFQKQSTKIIEEEVRKQMPVVGFEGGTFGGAWRKVESWPS